MTVAISEEQVREAAGRIHDAAISAMKPETPRYSGQGEEIARFQFIEGYSTGHAIALAAEAEREKRLKEVLERCKALIGLLTVRQVIHSGDKAIEASGLNPWCLSEGLATGDERVATWWIDAVLAAEEPTK